MGEISVLLVAATGVASLVFLSRRGGRDLPGRRGAHRARRLGRRRRTRWRRCVARAATAAAVDAGGMVADRDESAVPSSASRGREWLQAGRTLAPQRRSVIFEVVVRLLFHTMIVYSVFLLFSGHNAPGGGFAAGLVTGIALIVRYLAGGRYELGEAAPVQPGLLLGLGLFLSAGVGLLALLAGGEVLQSWIIDMPPAGHRRRPPGDVAVLRHRGVPGGRRAGARHPAQPRGGDRPARGDGRGPGRAATPRAATSRATCPPRWAPTRSPPAGTGACRDRHEPEHRPRRHHRRAVRRGRLPAAGAQPVARAHRRHPHRQRREPAVPRGGRRGRAARRSSATSPRGR